jgi:hypothetical protein
MAITTNGKVSITNLQVGSSADLASIISDESGTGVLAFTNSPTFTTPTLGTASATAIELGHASDTTLARASAGVVTIEGNTILVSGGALGTPSSATLTNATGLPVSGITASTSTAIGVGSIELGHATDTTIARASAGVVTIEGVNVVTTSSTDTLTNKTLTTPIISSISNTGTLTLPTTTGTIALTSDITVTASSTTTLTNKSISLATNTVTATLAELNTAVSDADIASLAGSETLTNKTLTSPTINTATFKDGVVRGLEEDINVVASAATGTINFDVDTASIWYYTTNATANHTLNFRYSSSISLNTALAVGDSITLVWLNTNGATAYYPNAITIDGNAVSPKVPAAISSGNASAIDAYSFTIIKTASATFTVLETQTKFA